MRSNRTDTAKWIHGKEQPLGRLTGEHETAGLLIEDPVEPEWDEEEDLPSAMGTFGTLQSERESELFSKIAEAAMANQPSRYERPSLLRRVLFIIGF